MNRVEQAAQEDQGVLWGIAYRITGVAADADEVVQDTFLRLMRSPPPDLERVR